MHRMSDEAIYKEGAKAFHEGILATHCPYAFVNSPYWATKDYKGFEQNWRYKLHSWMDGWIDAKKASSK